MLIVSKFRDYYDGLARQGVDKELVYKRETADTDKFVDLPRIDMSETERHVKRDGHVLELLVKCEAIVFCGKPYFFWRGEVHVLNNGERFVDQEFYRDTKKELFYAMRKLYGLKEPKRRALSWRNYLFNKGDTRVTFKEAFENFDWNEVHNSIKCPVFSVRQTDNSETKHLPFRGYKDNAVWYRVVKDPVLKDIGFERFVDPFTAWQEIYMYIGGVLGIPSRPMVELTDVDKRNKAGFDNWSFKKMPEKTKH